MRGSAKPLMWDRDPSWSQWVRTRTKKVKDGFNVYVSSNAKITKTFMISASDKNEASKEAIKQMISNMENIEKGDWKNTEVTVYDMEVIHVK